MVQNNLEVKLREFYEGIIDKRADLVMQGRRAAEANTDLKEKEHGAIDPSRSYNQLWNDIRELRQKIFPKIWYNRLKQIKETQPELLETLYSQLPMEALTEALSIQKNLSSEGRFTEEDFTKGFNILDYCDVSLISLILPLQLLEIARRDTNCIEALNMYSKCSIHLYYQSRLNPKKPTLNEIIENTAERLLEEYDPELVDYLSKFSKRIVCFSKKTKKDIEGNIVMPAGITEKSGKYRSNDIGPHYRFSYNEGEDYLGIEKYFDDLTEDMQMRNSVYYLAMRYLNITKQSLLYADQKKSYFLLSSSFWLTDNQYSYVINGIKNLAKNQLLLSYRINDFKRVDETYLSKMTLLEPRNISDNGFEIYDDYKKISAKIDRDSSIFPTRERVPMTAYLLHRAYLRAQKVLNIREI